MKRSLFGRARVLYFLELSYLQGCFTSICLLFYTGHIICFCGYLISTCTIRVSLLMSTCYIFVFIQFTAWTAWSSCSAPPGQCSANSGTRRRSRRIISGPSCGGSACPSMSETSRCTPVPISCKVIVFFPFRVCLFRIRLFTMSSSSSSSSSSS